MNFKEHRSTESHDQDGSQYYSKTVLDSGKPLAIALAASLMLVGTIAAVRAVTAPSDVSNDLSDLRNRQTVLEGKVTALEEKNQRLNNDLYDLRTTTDARLNQVQPTVNVQVTEKNENGIRLW